MRPQVAIALAVLQSALAGPAVPWQLSSVPLELDVPTQQPVPRHETSSFIVIVDAGSTGTRAHAFYYTPRVIESTSARFEIDRRATLPAPLFSVSARPGISSFVDKPEALKPYLKALVHKAAEQLLAHEADLDLKRVPIYLGATAGMRALNDEQRSLLMRVVRRALWNCPFHFHGDHEARVLSGEEEGAFSWLAVNYQRGTISANPLKTMGAIDMGGESSQISFIPEGTSIMDNLFPMHFSSIPGGSIHMYTHSFQRFGYITAFQDASTSALRRAAAPQHLEHPCLPRGIDWRVEGDKFGFSTTAQATRSNGSISMRGSGNFFQCMDLAKKLIIEAPCSQPPCSVFGVYQPTFGSANFLLTGEYAKAGKLLAPLEGGPPLRALYKRARDFCELPLEEQTDSMSKAARIARNPELACWLGVWTYTVLTEGFGFRNDTKNVFYPEEGQEPSDWPQGQAIYEVNFFPYKVRLGGHNEKLHHSHNRLWIGLLGRAGPESRPEVAVMAVGGALLAAGAAIGALGSALCRPRSRQMPASAREPLLVV